MLPSPSSQTTPHETLVCNRHGMEHALARPFRTASGQLNRRFAAGPFRVMLQKERRRLASFAVTGNVSGVCLRAPASDPLHCTTTPPSERSMLESRHTCMTRFRQLALLVYPTLAESAADCPVPSLIPMEFAPNVLAQRKNDIGP